MHTWPNGHAQFPTGPHVNGTPASDVPQASGEALVAQSASSAHGVPHVPPPTVATAVYLTELCPRRARAPRDRH